MAETTKIQWCDHTFNPWRGCTKVSPGCANCYAEQLSKRNPAVLGEWGPKGARVVAAESYWRQPLAWDRAAAKAGERRRVFCASLADVFEDWTGDMVDAKGERLIANDWWPPLGRGSGDRLTMSHVRERLGELIRVTPSLDWLLLTKRPENLRWMAEDHMFGVLVKSGEPAVPANLWLGVSVENQGAADERIPLLLQTPAAVRFLSVEPLLGPVDLSRWLGYHHEDEVGITNTDQSLPREQGVPFHDPWVSGPDWVIVGGESGPDARTCDVEWIRSVVTQCRDAGVPCFVKQLGSRPWEAVKGPQFGLPEGFVSATHGWSAKYRDKKGGDPSAWPADLRVREFPKNQPA